MEGTMTCIVCPRGCQINYKKTKSGFIFDNNGCKRGPLYVEKELVAPERMLTTTIPVMDSIDRLPVVSTQPIPKDLIFSCLKIIKQQQVHLPIQYHQVIVENILDLGIDIVAAKSLNTLK